jgi:1-acyl-sn-glycerol-3-phosphate acyltransferase
VPESDSRPHSQPAWLTALVTLTGNLYLVGGTALFAILTLLVAWVPRRSWSFAVIRIWANGVLAASGLRVEVHVAPELEPGKSYVFLANHQSLFDIPVVIATSPGQLRMVAKQSLFKIPLFGWALRAAGFISVDRDDRSTATRTFASAFAHLRQGTSMLLFPEGTRSLDDTLLPFQRGGFLLALKSGLPIVPVGIRGSRAVQSQKSFVIHPNTVAITYGAPIDPADFGLRRKRELTAEVRRRIAGPAGLDAGEVSEVVGSQP